MRVDRQVLPLGGPGPDDERNGRDVPTYQRSQDPGTSRGAEPPRQRARREGDEQTRSRG